MSTGKLSPTSSEYCSAVNNIRPNNQTCNAAGRLIIEDSESFQPLPYRDPNGIPTQGYGHTQGVTMDAVACTPQIADIWMESDLKIVEACINSNTYYLLTSNQFSALCSLAFNIGIGNFERSSALALINIGDFGNVPAHMELWNKDRHGNILKGLVTRRKREVALWNTPDPEDAA